MKLAGDQRVATPGDEPIECQHADRCSGCTQLALTAPERAEHKLRSVQDAIRRYPWLRSITVADIQRAQPILGYRTRVKLVVDDAARIGLYARGTHDVVDIPGCRVVSPAMARVLERMRELAHASPGALQGVDVRELSHAGAVSLLVTLIGEPSANANLDRIAHELAALPEVLGVARSARERAAPTVLGAPPQVLIGPHAARDSLTPEGPYHFATHGSFVQAHRTQAAALGTALMQGLEHILDGLTGRRILELYAGAGALALRLCQRGAHVLANERFAPGQAGAANAADEQGICGLQLDSGDAADLLARLTQQSQRFDAVVVNPPRRGLPVQVRSALAALAPRAIAYVSCDPGSLARDLDHLALLGYATRAFVPYDMIPLSDAVESLVLLVPQAPPALRILYEDERLLAVDKPPHLSTIPQGERAGSLLELLRRQRGLPELTAVHRLDQGTSGVCLFARTSADVAPLAEALRAGEKQYLGLARGIMRDKGVVTRPLVEGRVRRDARTRYTRLELLAGHSLLRVRPDQGRKHQIRRHLASLGHALLGDSRYGDVRSNRHFELRYGLDRPFLHLAKIELCLPDGGQPVRIEAPLPGDLAMVCDRLRRTM